MTDSEILDGLMDDVMSTLADLPEIGRVLRSTDATDLILRDVEGQLPAVGVADVEFAPTGGRIAIGQKRFQGRVEFEITVAAPSVGSSSAAGRDLIRRTLGVVNKRLDYKLTPYNTRYSFLGFAYQDQPRLDAVVGVLRYGADAYFGQE